MAWYDAIFGDGSKQVLKGLSSAVSDINALEAEMKALSDAELRAKTAEFKQWIAESMAQGKGEKDALEAILPEAFAVVREGARRALGQRHFDVQLMGGMILHRGNIAEMRTGEGKTLVATLPAYLNALSGKGVHVVTVNDYLSRRDAVWMGRVFSFLGLSVGVINTQASYLYDPEHKEAPKADEQAAAEKAGLTIEAARSELGAFKVFYEFLRPCSRREAYAADITYGTNNEFGFDYLRDNIEYDPARLSQRGFHYAIVDEIDSILIDEARTPLIISAPTVESEDLYGTFASIVERLSEGEDYEVDEKFKTITLKDSGIEKAEKALGVDNIYTEKGIKYVHHLETAVRAKALYRKDKEYVVRDGEVLIVDEFTGRLQPGRRWSEGLHQAIEAKEGVRVQKESRTYASITFQNYFRLYEKLSGMTGTAQTSREEFYKVYGLDTVVVPTNKPIARVDHDDLIFQTEKGKFKAIAAKVKELNKKGQPVLIGTVSIEKNEMLSQYLSREGVPHQLLNAKPQHAEKEGEVVAQAGRKGAVTIATNMAGRGVDIKLGGAPCTPEQYEEVKALGGLFVLGTERHEARRIDNQLRGRSGRQGDPGATEFYVSLEDSLMRIFASDTLKRMMGRFGIPEDEPIKNRLITRSLESAQTKIEGFNFDARKSILEYDDVLNLQRLKVYERRRAILLGDHSVIEKALEEAIDSVSIAADAAAAAARLEDAAAPVTTVASDALRAVAAERRALIGEQEFWAVIRRLFLQTIDMFWVDHLEIMDYMRASVRLRAYGQRDPLVEYKREGLRLFKEMQASTDAQVVSMLPNIGAGAFAREEQKLREAEKQMKVAHGESQGISIGTVAPDDSAAPAASAVRGSASGPDHAVGRNDLCPCGSGKKYKKCHGKAA